MTDLEITKLCAKAMGYKFTRLNPFELTGILVNGIVDDESRYDPLHDDAQAMALVKKFQMSTRFELEEGGEGVLAVAACGDYGEEVFVEHRDLNRAICECVAKMQSSTNG